MYGSSNGQGVQAVPFPGQTPPGSSRSLVNQPPSQPPSGLLPGAHNAPGAKRRFEGAFLATESAGLILVPTLAFGLVVTLFMNVYYKAAHVVMFLLFVGIGVCVVQVLKTLRERVSQYEAPNTFGRYVSMLTLAAIVLAWPIGMHVYQDYVRQYWYVRNSNIFTNVLPSEAAAGYRDAGKLLFAEGTRVDVQKAVGYKDVDVYCVAPILDDMQADRVQFWAAGLNCCDQRGSFDCDDAWNPKAKGGITLKVDEDIFLKAVKQAQAQYNLASAEDIIFLRWVVDPEQVEQNYWNVARAWTIGSTVVFGAGTAVVVLALNFNLNSDLKDFVSRHQ